MKTLVCAIGRQENKYIREWVENYRKLGFTNICLYDNNKGNEEHFEDVIQDYVDSGFVIIKNFRDKSVCQLEAYNDCYATYGNDYDWIAFFDCDEYLTLVNNQSISELLNNSLYDKYGVLHINWMCYGDGDLLEISGNTLLDTITEPLPLDLNITQGQGMPDNSHAKSIIRGGLNDIQWLNNPHTPNLTTTLSCDIHGNTISQNPSLSWYVLPPTYDIAYIKHYTTKTVTDFAVKVLRGFPDQEQREAMTDLIIDEFFKRNKRTPEKEAILAEAKAKLYPNAQKHSCCIVVPVYKTDLSLFEVASIRRCVEVWGGKYDIILLAPQGMECGFFPNLCNFKDFKIITFPKEYFESTKTYSDLLLQSGFYKSFLKYEYMVIYQLDAWVFEDKLEYFMDMDYDYIGGPHYHYTKDWKDIEYGSGNGGFSLRKVQPLYNLTEKYSKAIKTYNILEDRIFSEAGANLLKIAPLDVARTFSFHDEPRKFYEENGNQMPMGCHNPERADWDFYADKITAYPLISIIMPVYNMENYIMDAINSVIHQTYKNWECIIINDGSTDNSEKVILDAIKGDKRFKYISQTNHGVANARNNAIRLSKGKYILPLDPDDMIIDEYAERGVLFLESMKNYSLYYGQCIIIGASGTKYFNPVYKDYADELNQNRIHNSAIYKRADYDRIGGYDENIKGYEDFEFYVRLLYHNDKVKHVDYICLVYRELATSRNKETMSKKDVECRRFIYQKNKDIYTEYGLTWNDEADKKE